MSFYDQTSRQFITGEYSLHRFKANYCDVCILVLKHMPRVFIGGGQFDFDGVAREADVTEIEALAERFDLPDLREIAARKRR